MRENTEVILKVAIVNYRTLAIPSYFPDRDLSLHLNGKGSGPRRSRIAAGGKRGGLQTFQQALLK